MQPDNQQITAAKARLRTTLIAARRGRSDEARREARTANSAHLRQVLTGVSCVAAYLPLPTEPLDPALLDELASTTRVLVPVVTGASPLDWCTYPAPVRRGARGIDEPVGERLGPEAIAEAAAVLIPALAVDRGGHRLGRGGGHYDRTLALRDQLLRTEPGGLCIAVLYDDELMEAIPFDALDQPVSAIVRPASGVLTVR